jgi:hypothetical protein
LVSLTVRFQNPDLCLDRLAKRPEADAVAVGKAAALTPRKRLAILTDDLGELEDEPALPDAGNTNERDELRRALLPHTCKRRDEEIELALPSDERRPRLVADTDAGRRVCLQRFPSRNRLRLAPRLHRSNRPVLDCVPRSSVGLLADKDAVDRRSCKDSLRRIHDVSCRNRLPLARPAIDRDEGHAGVDGDSPLQVVSLRSEPLPDCKCRPDGSFRVVLMGDGRAEDGHQRVTNEPLDRTAVTLDLALRRSMGRLQCGTDVLWVGDIRGGEASEVDDENGDEFALLRKSARRGDLLLRLSPVRRNDRGDASELERRVLAQNRLLELLQGSAWFDPELLDEHTAALTVGCQRFRLPTAAVQSDHELCAQPLAQGLGCDERFELADESRVPPECEVSLDPLLERLETKRLDPSDLDLCEPLVGEFRERTTAKEPKRISQDRGRLGRLLCPRLGEQRLEPVQVESAWWEDERVAGRAGLEDLMAQALPKLPDVDL